MSEVAGKTQIPSSITIEGALATQATPTVGHRNARLQHLRGFAACSVLLFHAAQYQKDLREESVFAQVFTGAWGAYGVATFFVLSGYLMAQLSVRDDPRRFLLNRILRIYPLMLIIVLVAIFGYLATGFPRRPDILALTLIPAGPRDYYLGVEWTLLFEMTYYVIIASAMLAGLRRWLEALFIVWLAYIVSVSVVGIGPLPTLTPTLTQLFGQSTNVAFALGFLLPRVLDRMPSAASLCALAVPLGLAAFWSPDENSLRWTGSISAALLVAAAVKARPQFHAGLGSRIGLRLGDASYALYLCHVPVIVISNNVLPSSMSGVGLFTGWVSSSLAIALLLTPVDLRLHARLKRWADGLPQKALSGCAIGFISLFVGIAVFADIDDRMTRRSADVARAALVANPPKPIFDLLAGLDSAVILNDRRAVLRGYGIDMQKPDEASHVAILQNGEVIGLDRMRRMRPKIAIDASRPDLKDYRFGFSVVTKDPLNCSRGRLAAKLILSDGRVTVLDSDALAAICAPPR